MTNWANWGCGKGRGRQCQTSRTESGLRFYTAKQERIRPISRIGRIGRIGERGVFQNVNVLFAMIASEIKLVKLD